MACCWPYNILVVRGGTRSRKKFPVYMYLAVYMITSHWSTKQQEGPEPTSSQFTYTTEEEAQHQLGRDFLGVRGEAWPAQDCIVIGTLDWSTKWGGWRKLRKNLGPFRHAINYGEINGSLTWGQFAFRSCYVPHPSLIIIFCVDNVLISLFIV